MSGHCVRDSRCTGRTRQADGTWQPAATTRGLCDPDADQLARLIRDTPQTWRHLEHALPAGQQAGDKISGSKTPPIPLRLDVLHVMHRVELLYTTVHELVADAAGLSEPVTRYRRDEWAVRQACDILRVRVPVLLALDEVDIPQSDIHDTPPASRVWRTMSGPEIALGMFDLDHIAKRVLGQTRLVHHLPEPCWLCGLKALTREDGGSTVDCRACGKSWPLDDYERLVHAWSHLIGKTGGGAA